MDASNANSKMAHVVGLFKKKYTLVCYLNTNALVHTVALKNGAHGRVI
jgi:hypothetical protein